LSNLHLFVACVLIWGTTWLAITFQLGRVAPDVSVFYRFLLASLLVFAYCAWRKLPLRYSWREHAWIALMGVLMFGVSYVFVYYAEQHVVSGLVAVGYSASPLLGMLGMRAFFGTPMTRRVALGSVLGIVGIALVFWPELGSSQGPGDFTVGATYTALAVLLSAFGSLVAHRNQVHDLPLWQSLAWGMLYGALFALAWALAGGRALGFEPTALYVLSLVYLAVFGSILAFASYLTLLKRIGAARAGYIGVMTPIVALVISAAFESFRWHPFTWMGIAISVAGNVVILRGKAR
jgi:drug/metabolite transporter (DMT)-like permease